MRSILDFISFLGMHDQGGDSNKVLSFSIDYSQGEIKLKDCIGRFADRRDDAVTGSEINITSEILIART